MCSLTSRAGRKGLVGCLLPGQETGPVRAAVCAGDIVLLVKGARESLYLLVKSELKSYFLNFLTIKHRIFICIFDKLFKTFVFTINHYYTT